MAPKKHGRTFDTDTKAPGRQFQYLGIGQLDVASSQFTDLGTPGIRSAGLETGLKVVCYHRIVAEQLSELCLRCFFELPTCSSSQVSAAG